MDKFKALEPIRLHSSDGTKQPRAPPRPLGPLIGRLPLHVHASILSYTAVPDIPSYARTCRAVSRLASTDLLWSARYSPLSTLEEVFDLLENRARGEESIKRNAEPPTLAVSSGDDGFDENPILIKQPAFACSLPVQILLNGIVLALTAVLLFHLLFTAQYHYPLAPLNYLLQLAGVLSLLISLIATLYVVLTSSLKDSREWPYMLTYLAKDVPPSSTNATDLVYAPTPWTTAELAAWYAMAATTSGLVQVKSTTAYYYTIH